MKREKVVVNKDGKNDYRTKKERLFKKEGYFGDFKDLSEAKRL